MTVSGLIKWLPSQLPSFHLFIHSTSPTFHIRAFCSFKDDCDTETELHDMIFELSLPFIKKGRRKFLTKLISFMKFWIIFTSVNRKKININEKRSRLLCLVFMHNFILTDSDCLDEAKLLRLLFKSVQNNYSAATLTATLNLKTLELSGKC